VRRCLEWPPPDVRASKNLLLCKKQEYFDGKVLQRPRGAPELPHPSLSVGCPGVGYPESSHRSSSTKPARQGKVDLYMGFNKTHSQQILQSQFCFHTGSNSLQMDLEIQGLQKDQNLHLVTFQGQNKLKKLVKKEELQQ
jgi:hypothetical protein